ncbi:type II toxin-antitoxin system RelE/ParE family toxin [Dryocola sp. BD613]|uniref:type II toxin-antitoxin system RelE/ParE family toxin n=1 Tax=Dryocola sp. BD613 TaxID=3133272 RepID=UPI003F4FDDDD
MACEPFRADILAAPDVPEDIGPYLGRPYVDTLNGSTFPGMKAFRIQRAGTPIRIFFAFDPIRRAIV